MFNCCGGYCSSYYSAWWTTKTEYDYSCGYCSQRARKEAAEKDIDMALWMMRQTDPQHLPKGE